MNRYQVALKEQQGLLVRGGVGVESWQAVACQVELDEKIGTLQGADGIWSFGLYLPRWEKPCLHRKVIGTLHFLGPNEVDFHDYLFCKH